MCLWVNRVLGLFSVHLEVQGASKQAALERPSLTTLGPLGLLPALSSPGLSPTPKPLTTWPIGWAPSPTCRWVVASRVRLQLIPESLEPELTLVQDGEEPSGGASATRLCSGSPGMSSAKPVSVSVLSAWGGFSLRPAFYRVLHSPEFRMTTCTVFFLGGGNFLGGNLTFNFGAWAWGSHLTTAFTKGMLQV